ncbi:OmpP1/FadL family transporter [Aeoliella mucimassa]|uniref:OmpP1/FadL family transporter n=1 Tax=Aeoliella mucimassa TaxID=2527972 RepID=UPI0018D2C5FC|nr:outer membrane protein transport protein [Aeoliella mucimassa]
MRRSIKSWMLLCCLMAAAALMERRCQGDGITLDGVSAVSIGRGGTNLGFADNGSMLHDNPGALGQMKGDVMLQLGATALFTQFDYGDADNVQQRSQNQMYALPEFTYIKRLNQQWTSGFGIYTPTGFGSIYNLEGPAPFGGPQHYESFGSLTKVLFGASYTPCGHEYVSFGGTIGPAISFVNVEGPYTLQGPTAAGLPGLLDLGVEGAGLTWSLGASCQLTESTSMGFSYLAQVDVDADGEVGLTSPLGRTTYDTDVEVKWPASVGLGLKQDLSSRTTIACDVIWTNWSNAFDQFVLNLSSPTNVAYPAVAVESFPLNWSDTLSTRVGIEHRLCNGHIVRAGYVHHKSPIPPETINVWMPGALENAFSLGYGVHMFDWDVNLSYMFSVGPTVEVGTSDFIGGDFDNSVHRNKSHAASISFTRTFGTGEKSY